MSSSLAPLGCRDLNVHPLLCFAHLANRSPEIHQPKPRFLLLLGVALGISVDEGREERVEAGGKKGWGDRGDEWGRGDPEKTESGSLALSDLWTKSRFGILQVGPSGEVALENTGIRNSISSTMYP